MSVLLTLCWKEYREQRMVWLAIALLAAVVIVVPTLFLASGDGAGLWNDQGLRFSLFVTMLALTVAYGVVSGGMLLAGEFILDASLLATGTETTIAMKHLDAPGPLDHESCE